MELTWNPLEENTGHQTSIKHVSWPKSKNVLYSDKVKAAVARTHAVMVTTDTRSYGHLCYFWLCLLLISSPLAHLDIFRLPNYWIFLFFPFWPYFCNLRMTYHNLPVVLLFRYEASPTKAYVLKAGLQCHIQKEWIMGVLTSSLGWFINEFTEGGGYVGLGDVVTREGSLKGWSCLWPLPVSF